MRESKKQDWSPREPGKWWEWKPARWPAGDEDVVPVIFRKYKDDEIIALFPTLQEGPGLCLSYMHHGQHGSADRELVTKQTSPATLKEYRKLAFELEEHIGYKLKPITRWPD